VRALDGWPTPGALAAEARRWIAEGNYARGDGVTARGFEGRLNGACAACA